MRTKHRVHYGLAAALAVVLLAALLCGAALAANFLGLRDLLLPATDRDAGSTDRALSLSGYRDAPESRALAEWRAYEAERDPKGELMPAGGQWDVSLGRYKCYQVFAPDMAAKLEEILEKYGLRLHTAMADVGRHPELRAALGDFLGRAEGDVTVMYEDGSFLVDEGWIDLSGFGTVGFQLQRAVRGSFHDGLFYVDVDQFEEWSYETSRGLTVMLALGRDWALVLADLPDSFVTVSVWTLGRSESIGAADGLTRADLEELADGLDLGRLTPVVPPALPPEPEAPVVEAEQFDPSKLPEDAAEGTIVEGSYDAAFREGGRELTLRVHCRAAASGYGTWTFGVGSMEVLAGGETLQTIRVADGILAALQAEGMGGYGEDGWTACYEERFRPELVDLNFDGCPDIRLMEFMGNVNGRYLHWLWDGEAQRFVYAFCLTGYSIQIDDEARELVVESRESASTYVTDRYAYDADGALRLVDSVRREYSKR